MKFKVKFLFYCIVYAIRKNKQKRKTKSKNRRLQMNRFFENNVKASEILTALTIYFCYFV